MIGNICSWFHWLIFIVCKKLFHIISLSQLGKEKSGTIHVQGKIGTEGQCSSPGSAYGDFNYHVVEERVRVFINEIEIVSVNGTYKLADSIFTPNREVIAKIS